MLALTPSERRGALVLVLLLLIGAAHDLWRAHGPAAGRAAGPREERPAPLDPPPGAAAPDPDSAASAGAGGSPGTGPSARPGPRGPAAARRRPVDLNRAGARELDGLPGIGPVLAERIVLQRRRYGPFLGLDELLAVRGVGPRLLERIRPWAIVGPSPGTGRPPAAAGASDSAAKTSR